MHRCGGSADAADPANGKELRRTIGALTADDVFDIGGRHYKRVPRDLDADHPNADFLLHNGLYPGRVVPVPAALQLPAAIDNCATIYERIAPSLLSLARVTRL